MAAGPGVLGLGAAGVGLARSLAIYYGVPLRGRRLRRFYAGFLRPGDLYFDIGAHVGHRVRAALALGARVVALEPQPACFRLLRVLYGRSADAILLDQAIGEAPGTALLRISSATPTVSSTAPDWIGAVATDPGFAGVRWDRSRSVPVTTLDRLIAMYGVPAYAKIDVEGAEPAALRGLSQPLPHVSFEALPAAPAAAHACVARLAELGTYRFNLVRGETARFAFAGWLEAPALLAVLARETRSGDVHARLVV